MELILWRHASADLYEGGQRILDARGHQQAAVSGAWLQQNYPDCTIWASEAKRTQETASYYPQPTHVKRELNPSYNEEDVFIAVQNSGEKSLILTGHQLWIGALASRLAGDNSLVFFGHSQIAVFAFHNGRWRYINKFIP